jgi:hypothetical protein
MPSHETPQPSLGAGQQGDRVPVESLDIATQALIRRVLAFIATMDHLDSEFETRIGVERGEVAALLMRWPHVDDQRDDSPITVAINNALNEVANGLALSAEDWQQLGASRAEVEAAHARWASARG